MGAHSLRVRVAAWGSFVAFASWAPLCQAAEEAESVERPREELREVAAPVPEGVPSLQMSTDYAHPALGFGTYLPMGQVEARAIRVAPFTILAAVQTGVGYDDNVALRRGNERGSMFYTVAPSIAVGLEGALERYYLVYRGNYGAYASSAQDDYADHNIALTAANSWTTRFRTLAAYEYVKGHTPRGINSGSLNTSERWSVQSVRASASYGADGAIGRLDGNVGHSTRRYSTNTAGAVSGEYDRLEGGAGFSYRVGPKTRAVVQIAAADISHANDVSLDNTEMRYLVGATWEALAKTTGSVRVGYTTKDFSSARSDFSGQSYEADVSWAPQTTSIVSVRAGRSLSESYEIWSDLVVNDVFGGGWNHLWPRGIRSTISYVHARAHQEGLARTDVYDQFGARVSYPVRRSLRVGGELRREARNSDAGGLDYTRNIMLITLETAL